MKGESFRFLIEKAIEGNIVAIGEIILMYEPLIRKYSYIYGKLDEDLQQILRFVIFNKIHKFKI